MAPKRGVPTVRRRPVVLNVGANLLGGIWTAALSLLVIPLYVHLLGAEAFGLIGVQFALQAVFGLLDFGLTAAFSREMARLAVTPSDGQRERNLLRTLEVAYGTLAAASAIVLLGLAGTIADRWIRADQLPRETVEAALVSMAVVVACQFPFALYQAGLQGRERQVAVNAILAGASTLRGGGAVLLMWLVAPSVPLFFAWHALVAVGQVLVTGLFLWRDLGGGWAAARPRIGLVAGHWRFSAMIAGNAVLGVILSQTDKLLLSGMLRLDEFGYYTLAGSLAAALWLVITPVATACYPRFVQVWQGQDTARIAAVYHRASQSLAALLLPVGVTTACFVQPVVMVWTHNATAAEAVATVGVLLVCGTMLNGLTSVPAYFGTAAGFPQIVTYTNLASVIVLVPALLLTAPRFGALAAGAVCVLVACAFVVFMVPAFHRRVLPGQQWRWYVDDFGRPLAVAAGVGILSRLLFPTASGAVVTLCWLAVTGVGIAVATVAVLPEVRLTVMKAVTGKGMGGFGDAAE